MSNRMMLKTFAVPLALLLAACGETGEQPAADQAAANEAAANAAQPAAEPAAEVPSLSGAWTVTQMNARPLNQIFTMNANVTDDRFTINSDCVAMNWAFQQNGNALSLTPASTSECARGRTQDENTVERVMEGINMALFAEGGDEVQLSGYRGTITMTRR